MVPVLYSPYETAFTSRGIGNLSDCISCTVVEERNGAYELEMVYPVGGNHYAEIADRSIIMAIPSPYRDPQPFRVYYIEQPINGIVTIKAHHISYDLCGVPVEMFTTSTDVSDALDGIEANEAVSNQFSLSTNKTTSGSFSVTKPMSVRSALGGGEGSILDVFGGEFEFDVWDVKLLSARGSVKDYKVSYSKNITAFKRANNMEKLVTGIYPFWQSNGTTVTLLRKVVDIYENAVYPNVITVDLTDKFESQPSRPTLLTAAEQYIEDNDLGMPQISLDVSFVDLASTEEYAKRANSLQIDLCDTVTVEFPMYGVQTQAKIVRIVTNVLLDRYETITIGQKQTTIADTIAGLESGVMYVSGGGGGGGGSDVLALSIAGNVISLSQNGTVVSSITLPVYGGGVS